jgi:hypothetical protein
MIHAVLFYLALVTLLLMVATAIEFLIGNRRIRRLQDVVEGRAPSRPSAQHGHDGACPSMLIVGHVDSFSQLICRQPSTQEDRGGKLLSLERKAKSVRVIP